MPQRMPIDPQDSINRFFSSRSICSLYSESSEI
jgi:hypothetical protein